MRNKTIFIGIVAALFVFSAVVGYFGPGWLRDYRASRERADFVPAGVPKSVTSAFSRHFDNVDLATEPKRLPDDAFSDVDGKEVRIKDFAGKPTLINLWATWCAPCVVELPSLNEFAKKYGDRLNVVAISLDEGKTPAQIAAFLEKRELGGLSAYIDQGGGFGKNLGIRGIPTSFLIGSDGLILYRFEGEANWASQESKAFFDIFLLQKR